MSNEFDFHKYCDSVLLTNYGGCFSIEDVSRAVNDHNIASPLFLYVNPLDISKLKNEAPNIDKKAFICSLSIVDQGNVILIISYPYGKSNTIRRSEL